VIAAHRHAHALTNLELRQCVGLGDGRRGIHIRKTIHVAAPVARVFEFWNDFRNFLHFMTHVREVEDLGFGLSRWKARCPVASSYKTRPSEN